MQLELRYQMPFDRLAKLSRSAGRKAYRSVWLLSLVASAAASVMIFGSLYYEHALDAWMRGAGLPAAARSVVSWLPFAVPAAALLLLRRLQRRQMRRRAGPDMQQIRLSKDEDGLRFVTDYVDYRVKWHGITQMLMEHDGVVVSIGNLFFLVPDTAFPDSGTRLAFIQDVYGRLTEKARSISEKHILPVMNQAYAERPRDFF